MATAVANYCSIAVDVGAHGHQSDGGVGKRSAMGRALQQNKLNFPEDYFLPGLNVKLPYTVVADAAFSLSEHILRPYGGTNQTHAQRIFNYRLSRGRGKVENVFGIFPAGRWRRVRKQWNYW